MNKGISYHLAVKNDQKNQTWTRPKPTITTTHPFTPGTNYYSHIIAVREASFLGKDGLEVKTSEIFSFAKVAGRISRGVYNHFGERFSG
jgi:hypothetical protein